MVRHSTVFNLEQIDGVDNPFEDKMKEATRKSAFSNIESCEELLKNVSNKIPEIKHGLMDSAYYAPNKDLVVMPTKERFDQEQFYCQ